MFNLVICKSLQLKEFPTNNHVEHSLSKRINKQQRQGVSLSITWVTYLNETDTICLHEKWQNPQEVLTRLFYHKKIYHPISKYPENVLKQKKGLCSPPIHYNFTCVPPGVLDCKPNRSKQKSLLTCHKLEPARGLYSWHWAKGSLPS